MSECVTVEAQAQVNIEYVKCEDCGKELSFDVRVDGFGDVQITVTPCECIKEEED